MQHDINEGLLHFDERELELTGERRTPVDARVAPFILKTVQRRLGAASDRLDQINTERYTHRAAISRRDEVAREIADLQGLATGLETVADIYNLQELLIAKQ